MSNSNPVKELIFSMMEDRRSRTLTDVCMRLNRTSRSLRTATGSALKAMSEQGILLEEKVHGVKVWQSK